MKPLIPTLTPLSLPLCAPAASGGRSQPIMELKDCAPDELRYSAFLAGLSRAELARRFRVMMERKGER